MPAVWISLAAVLLALPAAAQPTLVVAPLERVQTRQSDATTLTEMIRIQIGKSRRYTLVTPEEQHNIDAELKRQLSGGCSEASCITHCSGGWRTGPSDDTTFGIDFGVDFDNILRE